MRFLLLLLASGGFASLCAQAESNCGDGIDNDGDGLIDCFDSDCQGVSGCEDFFFNPPEPDCGFVPPPLEMIELNLLYRTDEINFPIDQRSGVYVGDMNGDGIPDLVSRDNNPPRIQIYSGDDGRILQSIVTPSTQAFGQVAIADVDADGLGDIFHIEFTGRLARYEFGNPTAVWRTANDIGDDNSVSTPQLADINQDGVPEVYVGDRIFNALTGERYVDGDDAVNTGGYAGGNSADRYPIYFDLYQPGDPRPDGSGNFGPEAAGLEYIAGNGVWTVTFDPAAGPDNGNFQLAARFDGPGNLRDGLTSIADINGDGRMDVAVMDAGDVYAWDPYTNQLIGNSFQVPNTAAGGRINIGDFDGDGDVELGFAGRNIYVVRNYIDNDGDANPNNGTWSTLWQKTGLDDGSQRTGSTLFDFDGNGTVEVVYSEEENLFIYDGPTGDELFRITSRSGTRTEYPLVADVNGDGTAEIILTAQELNGPQFSGNGWVSVYESANQPWVPARQVWNQHGYNVTNVNDDLTIPRFQQDNLNPGLGQRYNNFLVQTSVGGTTPLFPAPDAIIRPQLGADGLPAIDFSDCPNTITLTLVVENDGSAPLPASTPISFYDGNPRAVAANLITTISLAEQVEAGDQEIVLATINVASVPAGTPLWLSVNDPGFAAADLPFDDSDFPATGIAECIYSNNISNVGNVRCGEVCNNGTDDDGDGIVDEPNLTQFNDTGCPGESLLAIVTDVPGGTWSVVGGSTIGTTVDQNGVVTLGNNFTGSPITETIRYDDGICFDEVTVTSVDDTPPALICPGDARVALDADCMATLLDYTANAQTSDDCTPTNLITLAQVPGTGSVLALGANAVMITATDQSGNATNCTFTVTAEDNTPPTISCPPAADVTVDADCQYVLPDVRTGATTNDNCSGGGTITVTQAPAAGQIFSGDGTTALVTLTATDEAGNTANCTYTLTLDDADPPTLTCPGTITRDLAAGDCTFAIPDFTGQASLNDNCSTGNQISVTQMPAIATVINAPTTTVITLTATDNDGNTTDCTFDLVTLDRTPPVINCPGEQLVNADPVNCTGTITDVTGLVTISDNCGSTGVTITQSPLPGTTFNSPTQNVVVTVTDASGNRQACTVPFRRQDITPPVLNCPPPQTLTVAASNCLAVLPDFTAGVASDACGGVSVVQQPVPGTNVSNDLTVALTATDSEGFTTTCTFAVTVVDNIPPVIACPPTQILAVDGSCAVPLPDYTALASVNDNCDPRKGPVTVTQAPAANTMFDINDSPVTVTLTATDASGNIAVCDFQVMLVDNQPPMITCPVSPQLDQLDGNCDALLPDFRNQVSVSSTCGMSTFTLTQMPAPATIINGEQTVAVTITATDAAGNAVSCTFNYQTEDATDPTLTCPADQTAEVDGSCSFVLPDYTGLATVADNCSSLAPAPAPNLTLSQLPAPGTIVSGDGTIIPITIRATDAAGNSFDCAFDLTLADNTDPVVNCPPTQDRVLDGSCTYQVEDFSGLATVTDNCSVMADITITQSPAAGDFIFSGPGTMTITLTATDAAGNRSDCAFTLSVTDNTPPAITCPPAPTLTLDDNCEALVPDLTDDVTTTDNCQAGQPLVVTQDIAAGTVLANDGTTQLVTLTVTDPSGLTASCAVTVTLDDRTPPAVTCPPAQDVSLATTGCQVALPDFTGQLQRSDNCTALTALTVQQMPAAGTIVSGPNVVETITFSVDDGNGNTANCSFNVTLRDVTPPMLTCPSPQVLPLDDDCAVLLPDFTGLATVTDDCAMGTAIRIRQLPAAGTSLLMHGEQRTITLTADDGNGNTTDCTFTVTADDATEPMIVCPADREEAVANDCTFTLPDYTGEAAVMDNCSEASDITVRQMPPAGTIIPASQLDVPQGITLTATDAAGNTRGCVFQITPVDATAPVIICPPRQTIVLDAVNCEAVLGDYTSLGTVADNCTDPAAITVVQDIAPGTVFAGLLPSRTEVTLTATDASGNTAACRIEVVIMDNTPPVVNCAAASVTVPLDDDCNGLLPELTTRLTVTDNCSADALTILQRPTAGSVFNGDGTVVPVTFTVTDPSGNSTECMATVTFADQSPPEITCPVAQELNVDDSCPVPLPDYTRAATVSDNCQMPANITVTQTPPPGTMLSGPGTVRSITLLADDGNGNTRSCSFEVTLVDEVALDLTCPSRQIVIASSDNCDGVFGDYTSLIQANNRCMQPAAGVTNVTQMPAPGTLLDIDDLDIIQTTTITAQDGANNTSSCTFEVVLVDATPPQLSCPADLNRSVEDNSCEYLVEDFIALTTITDNCTPTAGLTVSQDPVAGTPIVGPNATETVTITATDPSGNQNSCTFTLQVADNTPPRLVCPAPDTLLVDADCVATIGDYTGQTAVDDNCTTDEDITFVQNPPPGTMISEHLTTEIVTIMATDGSGNTSSCSFPVTALDVSPPQVLCPGDQILRPDADCEAVLPDYRADVRTEDNCTDETVITLTQSPAAGTLLSGEGDAVEVTIIADDGNGNLDSCRFRVTLADNTPPVISCPADQVVSVDENCNFVLPDLTGNTTVTDNCTAPADLIITQNIGVGQTFADDETEIVVTLTADDRNGNIAQCVTRVRLNDDTPPVISCPADQEIFVDAGCSAIVPDYRDAVVTDNCTDPDDIVVTQMPAPGTILMPFDVTREIILTADDGNGNTNSCRFNLTTRDNTPPGITCPPNQTIATGANCTFTIPDYRSLATLTDNCAPASPLTVTQLPASGATLDDLGTVQEVTLTVTDASGNSALCSFTVTTTSPTPPPAAATVTLAVTPPPSGTGTVDLLDAFDNTAAANLSGIDLDQMLDADENPFVVSFHQNAAEAAAGERAFPPENYNPATQGTEVAARIEDPATGCFVVSRILLDLRTPGTSGAEDFSQCSRPAAVLMIDGQPQPGGQGTIIIAHRWTLIDAGTTGITLADLRQTDEQVVAISTGGKRSGTLVLEYQFVEDYGAGPVVASLPQRIAVELLQVGSGDFFWDGN